MRRALVDGDSRGWVSASNGAQAHRAGFEGEVRGIYDAAQSAADARSASIRARVAVCRRIATRRSDASADHSRGGALWRVSAEPKWRPAPACRAMEVRIQ